MNAMGDDIVNMIFKSADIVSRDFLGLSSPTMGQLLRRGQSAFDPLHRPGRRVGHLEWMVKTFQDSL